MSRYKQKIRYEKREEKPALPNRLCCMGGVEEEIADRQDTAERVLVTYRQLLPSLLKKLNRIPDPRQPGKVKHKMTVLMAYGILFFVLQMSSRREANREMSRPILLENLKAMFPELETLPHADTLERLLERIEVTQIQDCMIELLKDLIRRKKFKNYLHNKHYLIAIDGTQKICRGYKWASECLKRQVGSGEEKQPQYYVYVLEAVLVLNNGITLPVMSEFLKNEGYQSEATKQDCERKAFYRLAQKLKAFFPKTRIAVVVDGLYACGPVFRICRKNQWDYMIVFKEDSLKGVWHEAEGLMKLEQENRLECMWGDRLQVYRWANDIEYYYGKNGRKKEILHVVICEESWKETNRNTGEVEKKTTRYAWISAKRITKSNVFSRCTKMGRYRWKIENNILVEKHQGYSYEHCFSYNWNAMEGYHNLMKIGHFINVLALNSELLIARVKELGVRGFIKYLYLILSGTPLDVKRFEMVIRERRQWRLAI